MTAYMPIEVAPAARRAAIPTPATIAALVLVASAIFLRQGQFGNPIAGLDEQYYLLVGDRMWHGAVPYVDLWDRKPIGLFLLFAAIRVLPGDGVLAAQLVATAFVAATAWCVTLLARRSVAWPAATMTGVFYIAALNHLWGETTQSPVFYNLLLAIAALATLHAAVCPERRRRWAATAMLLSGIAIQIKTNAVFEGAFFGAWLVWATWRQTRNPGVTLRRLAVLALLGAAPTLAAMAGYAAMGEFPAWWQANVLSVLAKGRPTDRFATDTLALSTTLFGPVAILALIGLRQRTARFTRLGRDDAFLLGWSGVAVLDFIAIGGYFPHYAVPLLLACCPLVATAFDLPRRGRIAFGLSMLFPLASACWLSPARGAEERGIAATVVAALPADVRTRCLFIYEGPPIYYHLTHACTVSRFVFTVHLSSTREAPSLGVDPAAALRAALARRPGTVLTVAHSHWNDRNPAQEALLLGELRRHYRIAAILPHTAAPAGGELVMWRRLR